MQYNNTISFPIVVYYSMKHTLDNCNEGHVAQAPDHPIVYLGRLVIILSYLVSSES